MQLLDKVERRVAALEQERRLLRRSAPTSRADALTLAGGAHGWGLGLGAGGRGAWAYEGPSCSCTCRHDDLRVP